MTTPGRPWSEARARCERATPGPWVPVSLVKLGRPGREALMIRSEGRGMPIDNADDTEFIAHARTDLPAALDAIDAVLALPMGIDAYGGPGEDSGAWESGYESGYSAAMEAVVRALGVTE